MEIILAVLLMLVIGISVFVLLWSTAKKGTSAAIKGVKDWSKVYEGAKSRHEMAYDLHHNLDPSLREELQEVGIDPEELVPSGIDKDGYDEEGMAVLTDRNLADQWREELLKGGKECLEEVKKAVSEAPIIGNVFNVARDFKAISEVGVVSEIKEGVKRARKETRMTDQELTEALAELKCPKSKAEKFTLENLKWLKKYLDGFAMDHPRYPEVISEIKARIYRIASEIKSAQASSPPDSTEPDIPKKLKQLKDMLEEGLITEEEFNAKKSDLLKRM